MTRMKWFAVLAALTAAGCGGGQTPSGESHDESQSSDTAQVAQLEEQNAEAQQPIEEVKTDQSGQTEEAMAAQLRTELEAAREQQRAAKQREREETPATPTNSTSSSGGETQSANPERERKLKIFVGSLPPEHFNRWEKLAEQKKAGTIAPADEKWAMALLAVGEKYGDGQPFDEQDIAVLRSVGIPYFGTRDGSSLRVELEAMKDGSTSKQAILHALEEDAPKLGLDREQTASLGVWLASLKGVELIQTRGLLRSVANAFAERRIITNHQLDRIRGVPALRDVVATYEQALADPARAAILYANQAKASQAALGEMQAQIDAAQQAIDEDTPKLAEIEKKLDSFAKYKRLTERTQEIVDGLNREAESLKTRIMESRQTISSLKKQIEVGKQNVAEYLKKSKRGGD